MGWFDEQIRQRKQNDSDVFTDAFINIAGAVMGSRVYSALNDERQQTKNAFDEILRFYHVKPREIPDDIKDRNEQLEYLLRPHGIMRRAVTLSKGWYKDAIGAMLGIRKSDGMVVALIPTGFSGYRYTDMETGKYVKINGKNQELFEEEAIAFYKPLPLKELGISDLMRYILGTLSFADFAMAGALTLAVTFIGMLSPKLNNLLFSRVIEDGSTQILTAITVFMACAAISSLLLNGVKSLIMARINTKMSVSVQAATISRVMSLPAGFFKNHGSGELSARTQYIHSLCEMLVSAGLNAGLTSVFSLVYISQIFVYTPALVIPSLLITFVTVVFSIVSAFAQMKISKKEMELSSKERGMSYALISGVQKIKLSGAEKRAFARWGNLYAEEVRLTYDPPMFLKINGVISSAISLGGTLVMYWFAVSSGVSVADYYAFDTAYGMVWGAFMSLAEIALTVAKIKPIMDMVKPILKAVPEISEGKQVITQLSGDIELDNVSFRYNENMPLVIDDLSLKIRPGQYVAIVGATGCGKSTLLRLMMGFESPQKGAVYVDGKDIASVDLKSLRHNMGVVMQNGKLFTGDIFSNIIISAPWLTLDEAWHAAELSGIAEDIRRMPMGMHTIISEGSGGISGGQRQRLMIARAIAPKPKVLMFDEATSALDNLTQKTVSESLDSLKCTRIVIAHRLSTIRQCDRIVVLDQGKIIEDGTYDELMENGGFFAELVARQRLDENAKTGT